jgi:hydroxysqualene dehydroxylase
LAAAVEATQLGHAVTLFEMAPQLGGRARAVQSTNVAISAGPINLDNGQHILIGAYSETLALLRTVGLDMNRALLRTPLRLLNPKGVGLRLGAGSAITAFAWAVWQQKGWRVAERCALLAASTCWALQGFKCEEALTVAALTANLPAAVRHELIDPLCVAALNTPAADASARVFLRVLKDALFSGPGSADLLLPQVNLSALLVEPVQRWLSQKNTQVRLGERVLSLEKNTQGKSTPNAKTPTTRDAHHTRYAENADTAWLVNGKPYARVVLATTATEAARLTQAIAPAWAQTAAALRFEPIITVYLQSHGARLPEAMLTLRCSDDAPGQFVFDRGQLGGPPGLLAVVISGAQPWVDRGTHATTQAALAQTQIALSAYLGGPLQHIQSITEKRATFRCTPNLQRPGMLIAPNLHAAGDYIAGPYPATLEAAVRSGLAAVRTWH